MRRRTALLLVFTLCAALGPLATASAPATPRAPTPAPPPGPAPQIKFDATEVNLGEIVKGQDAVATFTYRNSGSVPLHILSAKPG